MKNIFDLQSHMRLIANECDIMAESGVADRKMWTLIAYSLRCAANDSSDRQVTASLNEIGAHYQRLLIAARRKP